MKAIVLYQKANGIWIAQRGDVRKSDLEGISAGANSSIQAHGKLLEMEAADRAASYRERKQKEESRGHTDGSQ